MLLCPRCSEALDHVFGGVAVCTRCEGAWVQQPAITTAFGNPRWPAGQNLWWREELDCPECAAASTTTRMAARNADNIMVDVCASHGIWLDHGELSRLMQLASGSDELLALQKRVHVGADPDELARRRMLWRSDLQAKRQKTAELNAWLEAEKARKAAEAAAAAKRREAAEAEARRHAEAAAAAAAAAAEAVAAAARAEEERRRRALERYEALVAKRAAAIKDRQDLQSALEDARKDVTSLEIRLAAKLAEIDGIEKDLKESEAETK